MLLRVYEELLTVSCCCCSCCCCKSVPFVLFERLFLSVSSDNPEATANVRCGSVSQHGEQLVGMPGPHAACLLTRHPVLV